MSLIVAPVDGFDALVSREDADGYAARMGYNDWLCVGELERDVAIRRATQYLMARYRIKSVYLDPVHDNVAAACCEAALRAAAGALYEDVDAKVTTSETVGPLSVTYSAAQRNGGQTRFAVIDDLLRGMTDARQGTVKMVLG